MFGIMLQKMWHKKWMNISLLVGCILLSATVVSFPIYRAAAYDRMLNEDLKNYVVSQGKWPTLVSGSVSARKDHGGKTIQKMLDFPEYLYNLLGVEEASTFMVLNAPSLYMSSDTGRGEAQDLAIRISAIENIEENSKILAGEMFSENGFTDDGLLECIISQSCMVSKGLIVGETFTLGNMNYPDGSPVKLIIKGVFDASSDSGYFWASKPESFSDAVICNYNTFKEQFTGDNAVYYSLSCNCTAMFDYEKLVAGDVARIEENTEYLFNKSAYKSVIKPAGYLDILKDYDEKISRISATLVILQVPVLAMLATFLFMISGQMYEMEKNEISVIKSRGSSRAQIIRLYFYQGLLLTVFGGLIGMPFGALFAKVLGATRNFLEFDFSEILNVSYTKESFIYLMGAIVVSLLSITIPSIKHSSVSIVKLKQSKALKRKSWWEKLFIDIILLGVSLYGFYSFHKNGAGVSGDVLAGESLDPLLYISSSLFILGAGLFFLRIQPYIVKLIYLIGKRKWGPAAHVSFMENIKNGRKQQLIMLFLIMTISLGMYHATVARTILDNAIENTEYLAGSDVIIKEVWTAVVDEYGVPTGEYIVPNYLKYNSMEAADSFTRVIRSDGAIVKTNSGDVKAVMLGINTKEFGSLSMVKREYLDKYYYEYLNDLAVVENGILVSKTFESKLGYKIGDNLNYSTSSKKSLSGKIVGFIDYFPSYEPVTSGLNPDGTAFSEDNYLIVANYEYVTNKVGVIPYEVWIALKDGYSSTDVYEWINENNLKINKYSNLNDKLEKTMHDPLLQGTNGVLTMGFVVTLVLCGVGYLIYWVMSIRERELIFGVLRATGLHKSEIIEMLVFEQIFSGLFSVFAGIGIGKLTSNMFVPILQQAYATTDQALPMKLITVASDMYRLYGVIAVVMIIVLFVLIQIISKMNVTKALKLGEE